MRKSISRKLDFIDYAIIILSALTIGILSIININSFYKMIGILISICITIVYLGQVLLTKKQISAIHETADLSGIALLNEENEMIKEWDVYNKTSLLIGRNSKKEEVDIDLSECTYASLVDVQHAVLNFAAGKWYIEDLHSVNGICLQKAEDHQIYKLSQDRPCQIARGDKLIIGKTQLLVR